MDGSRFDELTRALSAQRSRRAVLGALAGAALASVGLHADVSANNASLCRSVGNSCNGNGNCCSHNCVKEGRARKICHCQSAADCPASADPCRSPVCLPSGSCGTTINQGVACDDGNACTTGDVCQADGSCQGAPVVCDPPPNACFTVPACDPSSGACSDASYLGDGTGCPGGVCFAQSCCAPEDHSVTCGNGACGVQLNNCGQAVQCLSLANEACAQDGDCCSGVCVDGLCQAGPVAIGGVCDSNGDCASHACCGGLCVDTGADYRNCGACGHLCSDFGMAAVTCVNGVCGGTCANSYGDCNNDLADGCETILTNDPDHCGACGHACSSTNVATRVCSAAICLPTCLPGWADCNHDTVDDGCETNLTTDHANCGACGHACSPTETCCGGVCVDTSADAGNCGACGNICSFNKECIDGVCGCSAGEAFCYFSYKNYGCFDILNDIGNCGRCGNGCVTGQSCINGVCGCPAGLSFCIDDPRGCVDLQNDVANCGSCGNACGAGDICVNGYCVCDAQSCCPAGETYCPATVGAVAGCTDTATDSSNCGGCTAVVNGQIDLNATVCILNSNGKTTCCGSHCADTLNDPNNCGGCGHQCPTGGLYTGACNLGVCTMVGCPPGLANCDGNAGNGCETDLSRDPNNCGACGNVCPGQADGAICSNGVCCVGFAGKCGAGGLACCGGNKCGPFNEWVC